MDTDQESLLSTAERNPNNGFTIKFINGYNNSHSRWRKNAFLLTVSISIAVCLTVYLYLNMEAFDGDQVDPGRYKPLSRRKPMLDHESIFSDSGPSMIKLSDLLAHCIVALRVAGQEVVNLSLAHNLKLNQVKSKGKTLEGADDVVTGADIKSHKMILNTIKDSYRRLNIVSEEDSTLGFEETSMEDDILPIERPKFAQMLRSDQHEIEDQHIDRGSLIAQHETLVWIDPLDATKEYSENLTNYVTLMACIVHKSTPIAGVIYKPFTNETYWSMMDLPTGKYHHSLDLKGLIDKSDSDRQQSDNVRIIVSRSHAGDVTRVLDDAYGRKVEIISAGGSGYKTIELIRNNVDAYIHLTHIKKWDICAPYSILGSLSNGNLTDLRGNAIGFGNPKEKVVTQGLIATLNQKVHHDLLGKFVNYGN